MSNRFTNFHIKLTPIRRIQVHPDKISDKTNLSGKQLRQNVFYSSRYNMLYYSDRAKNTFPSASYKTSLGVRCQSLYIFKAKSWQCVRGVFLNIYYSYVLVRVYRFAFCTKKKKKKKPKYTALRTAFNHVLLLFI